MFKFALNAVAPQGGVKNWKENRMCDSFLLRFVTNFDEALAGRAPRFEKGKGSGAKEDPSPASIFTSL